ncbi:hypothetical protein [Streptomyces sp. NPDC089919]|uniref:hypothetical protein n=1 Tax=Streptomyces sp. NPDC089919 TaxID=3155188 RepID=UPI003437F1DB
MTTIENGEVIVTIDPAGNWYQALARGAAEARRSGLGLRLVTAQGSAPEDIGKGTHPACPSRKAPTSWH